jgi:VIT1/CCC1 family predicted Fe2+/Mn2+ transporter
VATSNFKRESAPNARDIARYKANRQAEVDSAALYRALAEYEAEPRLAAVFQRMADAEATHAAFWERFLPASGHPSGPPRPSWRARTLILLARRFGTRSVLPTVLAHERADSSRYDVQQESRDSPLPVQERSHGRLLNAIAGASTGGLEGATVARFEGRHRSIGGNALRAAVLGANDGLVSNLSLVMGVAGAAASDRALLVTGLAGLLAGAGSMAMGEWLSVQSSRELNQRQLDIESAELSAAPEEEAGELALIYQAKGLTEDQARELAKRLVANPEMARDTLAREELGIDPSELGGSAWQAAFTSFLLFALGAVVPVLPFFVLSGGAAIAASVAGSAVALFVIGAGITLLTGRSVWYSGARQLLFGLVAAGLTYGIGKLIGTSIGG